MLFRSAESHRIVAGALPKRLQKELGLLPENTLKKAKPAAQSNKGVRPKPDTSRNPQSLGLTVSTRRLATGQLKAH